MIKLSSKAALSQGLLLLTILAAAPAWAQSAEMVFQRYDGPNVPRNKENVGYPTYYQGGGEGGPAEFAIDTTKKIAGDGSLKVTLLGGSELYVQWNPWDGSTRDFARAYSESPNSWQFDTYNRWRFWFRPPASAPNETRTGQHNYYMGTYVKRVTNFDRYSDETGGGHFYHPFNILPGQWSLCILNTHPGHERGQNGGTDTGNKPYPTRGDPEGTYNYFDALTRFYIQEDGGSNTFPRDYWIEEMSFYQESRPENDEQVYSICMSVTPGTDRIFLTWNRPKSENDVRHEVRYAVTDIHTLGWENATPAPNGTITPPGWQGYNGMFYDTTGIDLSGRARIFMAIKPQNSTVFSQIEFPLKADSVTVPKPPTDVTVE